jgi:hypothetical protein
VVEGRRLLKLNEDRQRLYLKAERRKGRDPNHLQSATWNLMKSNASVTCSRGASGSSVSTPPLVRMKRSRGKAYENVADSNGACSERKRKRCSTRSISARDKGHQFRCQTPWIK